MGKFMEYSNKWHKCGIFHVGCRPKWHNCGIFHCLLCMPKVVDAKAPEFTDEGKPYKHVLTQCHLFKDKCDVETSSSLDVGILRVANVSLGQFLKRTSKAVDAIHPEYVPEKGKSDKWNTARKAYQYQRSLALVLVGLEACAEHGIHCHHPDGDYVLWPISWVFWTDRDEQAKLTLVNKAPLGKYVGAGGWNVALCHAVRHWVEYAWNTPLQAHMLAMPPGAGGVQRLQARIGDGAALPAGHAAAEQEAVQGVQLVLRGISGVLHVPGHAGPPDSPPGLRLCSTRPLPRRGGHDR